MKVALIGDSSEALSLVSWLVAQEVEVVWYLPPTKIINEMQDVPFLKMVHDPIRRIQLEFERNSKNLLQQDALSDLLWVVTRPLVAIVDPAALAQIPTQYHADMGRPMEAYESVDGVIELTHHKKISNYINPYYGENAAALDEVWCREVHRNFFYDGPNLDEALQKIRKQNGTAKKQKIFLLGVDSSLKQYLRPLWEMCKDKMIEVIWSLGFSSDANVIKDSLEWKTIAQEMQEVEQHLVQDYFKQTDEWNALEDYEKVKVARPIKPTTNWTEFGGYKIKSFAKLQNHEELMVHLENVEGDAKVFAVDYFNSFLTLQKSYQSFSGLQNVAGYVLWDASAKINLQELVEEKLFTYFTKS
jgi:hypothetical protein